MDTCSREEKFVNAERLAAIYGRVLVSSSVPITMRGDLPCMDKIQD
jgi:hypothetical protein